MSEEHLWPEWMHPYLPQKENPEREQVYRVIRGGREVTTTTKQVRQGQTYTTTFKVVCKRCNETWMGNIETVAKPFLIHLIQGTPVTLLRNHKIALARWFALKTLVIEQENPGDAVVDQDARTEFMRSQTIPDSVNIILLRHGDPDWYASFWHQTLIASFSRDSPPASGRFKNVQTTAIGVGHGLGFAFVTTLAGLEFQPSDWMKPFVRNLWPLRREPLVWPPLIFPDVNRLARYIDELTQSPMAEWRPFPGAHGSPPKP